jgi:hypothetical protein
MVLRVMKSMLKQTTHVASGCSNGETATPRVDTSIVGKASETFRGDAKFLTNLVGIGVGIRNGSGLDQMISERRKDRLILSQCLLDAVGVERGDVPTVRGVLDG